MKMYRKEVMNMESTNRIYAAIDLKSFYASVECIERNLDPLTTNLVVADNSRSEKQYALLFLQRLKPLIFREERGCLKLLKK